MTERPYTELSVWLKSRALVSRVYELTRLFPKDELYSLTNQMRRAAISLPSNIAEGCGRQHTRDTLQFLSIARGSLFESETQCYLAADQNYISTEQLNEVLAHLNECKRLLQGFIRYYRSLTPLSHSAEDPLYTRLTTDNHQLTTK